MHLSLSKPRHSVTRAWQRDIIYIQWRTASGLLEKLLPRSGSVQFLQLLFTLQFRMSNASQNSNNFLAGVAATTVRPVDRRLKLNEPITDIRKRSPRRQNTKKNIAGETGELTEVPS